MLSNIRVVLVNTSHPGNIGGAARAMKNMGLSRLVLVEPRLFPHHEADARASGAGDILEHAQVVATLEEALVGCNLVLGTSARDRRIPWPLLDPRECGQKVVDEAAQGAEIALVFGREDSGLTNEELQRCHYHVHIPSDPEFSSLNLGAAVQVLSYEIRMSWLAAQGQPSKVEKDEVASTKSGELATMDELERFYEHLEQTLVAIEFLDPEKPRHLMARLRRLYGRSSVSRAEMNILRGILTETQKAAQAQGLMMFERLREDIQSVFHRDPAARNAFEVLTCYPGMHAIWLHRLSGWLWHAGWKWMARLVSNFGRWMTGIEIHPGAKVGRRFFIDHGMGIVIGETAEIGDDVTLYQGVTLGGTSWNKGKRHPTLENGVVVGAGAKVLGPFTVGAGAKVGSNAVVTKPVPAGATVVGIPGRIIIKAEGDVEARRKAMAEKIGFDAYGVSEDMPDPVARAIAQLLDHLQAVDGKLDGMCGALKELGSTYCAKDLPALREEDFACVQGKDEVKPG